MGDKRMIASFKFGAAKVDILSHAKFYVGIEENHEATIAISGRFERMYLINEIMDLTINNLGINIFKQRPYKRRVILNARRHKDDEITYTLLWVNRI